MEERDKELIYRWQTGDESAFEKLYHNYATELLTIAVQKTNDREIATELVQGVFITFFNQKDSAHQITSLLAYLYTILKNRILDHHRHNLIRKKHISYAVHYHTPAAENDVTAYIETKELENIVSAEINKLPSQCKHVFSLRRMQHLSNKEVAHLLNISENTVEQHMRKALKLLKIAFLQKRFFNNFN